MSGTGILTAQLSQPSHGCASRRCDHRRFPGRIIRAWLYAGQRDARTSGPPVERLAAGPPARTTACHRPRVHSTGAAHEDSPRPPAILQVTPGSMLRQRSVLAWRHDMRLILRLSLQMLFGALLLERLARLLGKMLSGRFVGHGYSLRGSPPGSLAPPYAGRAVRVITGHPPPPRPPLPRAGGPPQNRAPPDRAIRPSATYRRLRALGSRKTPLPFTA